MFDAAGRGDLAALYVVGSNPVARYGIDPAALKNTFLIVQDMFLTETALLADVVFPAANLYEKAGTVTNTYGDLQLVKKAARPGRCAHRLRDDRAARRHAWAPIPNSSFPSAAASAPTWARPAERNPAKPTVTPCGWRRKHLEPKLSPFDPFAILDEIQRLVPGYQVSRLKLLAGNDEHVQSSLVQIDAGAEYAQPDAISSCRRERHALYLRHAWHDTAP